MAAVVENLKTAEKNIQAACERAGRSRNEVTLIAVSKTKPVELVMEAYRAGIRDFGENKVQELVDKYEKMPKDIRWHMIGHLQTNKVKYIVDKVCLIHSVDSLKLAEAISKEAVKRKITAKILVEVNIAGEETKFGVSPGEAPDLVYKMSKLPGIAVRGLMAIAPYVVDPEENRLYFRKLKQLSVDITNKNVDNVCMDFLSMGMTGDYQTAIEEGAAFVRVGTGLFGERDYTK